MGKRTRDRQPTMWVPTTELPTAASHPFYRRLNQLLREHGFDDFVEGQCASFYAETMGRPGMPPGIYFRLLLIGYFEGIGSERGIAWRAADSLALRDFLGVGLGDDPPDDSTISRTRRLIALETHRAVFTWVLPRGRRVGQGKNDWYRRHDARSQCRVAQHRPTRHGRGLRGVLGEACQGVGRWDADTRRSGADRSKAQEKRDRTMSGNIRTIPTRRSRK